MLQDHEYTGFDENIYRPEIAGVSIKKMYQLLAFTLRRPGLFITPGEFHYQYQWYVKRRSVRNQSPVDMTEAILTAHRNKSVKALFLNNLLTDPYFSRIKRKNWELNWEEGRLTELESKREYMAFHFQDNKLRPEFKIVQPNNEFSRFTVSPSGICP